MIDVAIVDLLTQERFPKCSFCHWILSTSQADAAGGGDDGPVKTDEQIKAST